MPTRKELQQVIDFIMKKYQQYIRQHDTRMIKIVEDKLYELEKKYPDIMYVWRGRTGFICAVGLKKEKKT